MKDFGLREKLCKTFCPYYKSSKKEDLACLGFLIVKELTKKGKKIDIGEHKKRLNPSIKKMLMQNLCRRCSYYEDDCDFAAKKMDASPCGGFTLLGHLLVENIIGIDDIKCID